MWESVWGTYDGYLGFDTLGCNVHLERICFAVLGVSKVQNLCIATGLAHGQEGRIGARTINELVDEHKVILDGFFIQLPKVGLGN